VEDFKSLKPPDDTILILRQIYEIVATAFQDYKKLLALPKV